MPIGGGHFAQRNVAPETEAAGMNMMLDEGQQERINATSRLNRGKKAIKEFNAMTMKFISFIVYSYNNTPGLLDGQPLDSLIRDITPSDHVDDLQSLLMEEPRNRPKQYRNKDIVWERLNFKLPQLYVTSPERKYHYVKNKDTGQKEVKKNAAGEPMQKGFDTHRKFLQGLEYCCNIAKAKMPADYHRQMENFKNGLKQEKKRAKGKGEIEEREADPISFELFTFLCTCAINEGDPLLWAMALLQWHCMARCQNIDDLTFRNFRVRADNINVIFDKTKMDKLGMKLTPKHCYANPENWHVCLFTALACYFCTMNSSWTRDRKSHIFINAGADIGSAASNYTDRIKAWVEHYTEKIKAFIRPKRGNTHGIRKGSATHATSNTTAPPPLASIFHRGEWSLGVVLEIYWRYAECGDQYLGRILAGLDANSVTFDVLPPHFTVELDDDRIKKAMQLCFGQILDCESEDTFVTALLFRCLASLVYHADSINEVVAKFEGHPFANIPLLKDPTFLNDLKTLVTIEPTEGILTKPTGIPPHTSCIKCMKDIQKFMDEEREERKKNVNYLKEAVRAALEDRDVEHGQLTVGGFETIFNKFEQKVIGNIDDKFEALLQKHGLQERTGVNENLSTAEPSDASAKTYFWDGHSSLVPSDFSLPDKTSLRAAFDYWVNGNPGNCSLIDSKVVLTPILPFQYWNSSNVPKKVWDKFKTGWKRILDCMMKADGLGNTLIEAIKEKDGGIPSDMVDEYYQKGVRHVLNKFEYIKQKRHVMWTITTWSVRIMRSEVMKYGTDSDKARLPMPTRYNNKHRGTKKRVMTKGSNRRAAKQRRIVTTNV